MRRLVLIAIVGALAACGSSGSGSSGGGSSSEKNAYVDAAMEGYAKAPASVKSTMSESQARCLVSGMVDIVGVDRLSEANIKPGDLKSGDSPFATIGKDITPAQATAVAALITKGKCFNFTDVVIAQMKGTSNPFGNLSETQVRCFFDAILKDKAVRQALADSILGKDSSSSALSSAFSNQSKLFSILGDCKISPSQLTGG
jgi:hypothetical protein